MLHVSLDVVLGNTPVTRARIPADAMFPAPG